MGEVFPSGYFFIRNAGSGKVIDSEYGRVGGRILVLRDRKPSENDTQLWEYTSRGFLKNKASGLYMQVNGFNDGGIAYPGAGLIQTNEHDPPYANLCWTYIQENRRLVPYDARLCAWLREPHSGDPSVTVDKVKDNEPTQQWVLEKA